MIDATRAKRRVSRDAPNKTTRVGVGGGPLDTVGDSVDDLDGVQGLGDAVGELGKPVGRQAEAGYGAPGDLSVGAGDGGERLRCDQQRGGVHGAEGPLVVGGTGGIGAGIARRFAKAGADVWIVGRSEAKGTVFYAFQTQS